MTTIATTQLTAGQRVSLNKIKGHFESIVNSRPQSVEIIQGLISKMVVCEGWGTRIVYIVTSHLNIKSHKMYKM